MKSVRFVSAVAAAVVAATLGFPGIAHASKTVKATIVASCPSGQVAVGGRFTVTSALSNTAPISINTSVQTLNRTPSSTSGTTNSYDGPFDGLLNASNPATTTVADNWSGKFELVSVNCKTPVAPTVAAQASLPGVPGSIHVTITNSNDIMFEYDVSAPSLGAQKVKVLGRGGNAATDLTTPVCGTAYQVVVRDSFGTQATATTTMPACPPGTTPPAASPSPTKATPRPSASPSASGSASPEPSAPTLIDGSFEALSITQGGAEPNAVPTKASGNDSPWAVMGYRSTWIGLALVALALGGCAVYALRRRAARLRGEGEEG